jgi:hypothetical protein
MEEMSFARYTLPREGIKRSRSTRSTSGQSLVVHAHLCEVFRLEAPEEPGRNPKWFSPEKTKRRLLKDRSAEYGDALASVVDAAIDRIRCASAGDSVRHRSQHDALRKVEFEVLDSAHAANWMARAAFLAYAGRSRSNGNPAAMEMALQTYLRRVLRVERDDLMEPRAAGIKKQRLLVGETTKPASPSVGAPVRVQRIDEPSARSRPRSSRE